MNSVKASINIQGGLGSSGAYNQMCERAIVLGWSSARNQDSRQWTGDGSSAGAGRHYRSQRTGSDSKCWTDKPLSWTMRPRDLYLRTQVYRVRCYSRPSCAELRSLPTARPRCFLAPGVCLEDGSPWLPPFTWLTATLPLRVHQDSPRKPPSACWDLVRRPRCSPRAACAGRVA